MSKKIIGRFLKALSIPSPYIFLLKIKLGHLCLVFDNVVLERERQRERWLLKELKGKTRNKLSLNNE